MGFSYFDHEKKRYWMGVGNVRSCQNIADSNLSEDEKKSRLDSFLARNAISVTKQVETEFVHPFAQTFPAEQRMSFEGVPPTEEVVETAVYGEEGDASRAVRTQKHDEKGKPVK